MIDDDAMIAIADAKLHYNFWRPITAIRNGELDGNPATEPDQALGAADHHAQPSRISLRPLHLRRRRRRIYEGRGRQHSRPGASASARARSPTAPSRRCRAGTNGSGRSAIRARWAASTIASRTRPARKWAARSRSWRWPRSCGRCRRRSAEPSLARRVVAQLFLGQLEADQMLEGRLGDRVADRRDRTADRPPRRGRPALRSRVSSRRTSSGKVADRAR